MKKKGVFSSIVVVIAAILLISVHFMGFSLQPQTNKNIMPVDVGPRHPVVQKMIYVSGSEYDQGYQYGFQLAKEIIAWSEFIWNTRSSLGTAEEVNLYVDKYVEVQKKYDTGFIDQMKGMVDGVKAAGYKITLNDVELIQYYWTVSNAKLTPDLASTVPKGVDETVDGCSSFAAWGSATKDSKPIYQMNCDFGAYSGTAYPGSIATIHYPDEGYPWIGIAGVGALGCTIGMNNEGLISALQYAPISFSPETETNFGMEAAQILYATLRKCKTKKEAVDFFNSVPKSMGQNYLFMDPSGNPTIIESSGNPDHQAVRVAGDFEEKDFVVMTNHWLTKEWKDWGYPDKAWMNLSTWYRYNTLFKKLQQNLGAIDSNIGWEIMSSHDYWDGTNRVFDNQSSTNSLCRHGASWDGSNLNATNYSCQFLPIDRELKLTAGNPCGTWPTEGLLGGDGYVSYSLKDNPLSTTKDTLMKVNALLVQANNQELKGLVSNNDLKEKLDNAKSHWGEGLIAYNQAQRLNNKTKKDKLDYLTYMGIATNHFAHAQAYARYVINKSETK